MANISLHTGKKSQLIMYLSLDDFWSCVQSHYSLKNNKDIKILVQSDAKFTTES